MNDPETIKILLDALTGTLKDLSTKFDHVVGSQSRVEAHLTTLDSNMVQQTTALNESRDQLDQIKKDLQSALATVAAVQRTVDGDGKNDEGIKGDTKWTRANMGWIAKWSELIRNPIAIAAMIVAVIFVAYEAKQAYDFHMSRPTQATEATDLPAAIQHFAVSAIGSNSISCTWKASSDEDVIAWYRITRNGEVLSIAAQTSPFIDTGLSPDTRYCYTIQAVDNHGTMSKPSMVRCETTKR